MPLSLLFKISVLFGCTQTSLYGFHLSLSFSVSDFHCPASIKKLQDQNESHQASRAKIAEGMALALEKKDQVNATQSHLYSSDLWLVYLSLSILYLQEWTEKMADVEKVNFQIFQ